MTLGVISAASLVVLVLLAGVAPASSVYTFQLRQLSNATGGTIFPLPPAIFLYQDGVFASTYSEGTCLCALKQTPSPYASIKQQESQRIVLRSDAPMTAGTFTLTFTAYGSPETTAPIPFNATADELEVALQGLSRISIVKAVKTVWNETLAQRYDDAMAVDSSQVEIAATHSNRTTAWDVTWLVEPGDQSELIPRWVGSATTCATCTAFSSAFVAEPSSQVQVFETTKGSFTPKGVFVNGVCELQNTKIDELGDGYSLNFLSFTVNVQLESPTFNVTLGPPKRLVMTQQPGTATGGVPFRPQPILTLCDMGGNTITWQNGAKAEAALQTRPTGGNGTLSGVLSTQLIAGSAYFSGLKIQEAGYPYTLRFTLTPPLGATWGATLFSTTFDSNPFLVSVGPLFTLELAQQVPLTVGGGIPFAFQPQMLLKDAGGNLLQDESTEYISVAIFGNPSQGMLSRVEQQVVTLKLMRAPNASDVVAHPDAMPGSTAPGWFKLSLVALGVKHNTTYLPHNASALEIEAALELLPPIDNCTVTTAQSHGNLTNATLHNGLHMDVWTWEWYVTFITLPADIVLMTIEWFPAVEMERFSTAYGAWDFPGIQGEITSFSGVQGGVAGTVETSGAGGNSAIFTVHNTGSGAYTFDVTTAGSNYDSDTTETYAALQGGVGTTVETSDAGANSAIVTIFNTGSGSYTFAVTTAGTNYNSDATVGDNTADKIVILGTSLGGATPANDCTLTVTGAIDFADFNAAHVAATETSTAGAGSAMVTVHTTGSGGAYSFTITAAGANYASGDTLVILGTSLGGATPLNDCTITTNAVGGFAGTAAGTPAAIGATGVTSLSSANLAITGTPVATSADKIVILGTLLGGATPANDCTLTVTGATGATGLSTSNVAATGTPVVITGTVETSDAGANSAIFTIHNTGSGAYTFTVTTAGTNYNSDTSSGDNTADKIVVLGTHLGGATPVNDCTLTVTGSAGAAVLSSANVAVTGTPIARAIATHPMVPQLLDPSLGVGALVSEISQGCTETACFNTVTNAYIGIREQANSGVVQYKNLRVNKVGVGYTLKFTAPNSGVTVATNRFNVIASDPVSIKLTKAAGSAWAGGEPFMVQPICELQDAGGNVIVSDSTSTVTASLTISPFGLPLLGLTTVSAKAGVATFEDLSLSAAAVGYVVRYSSPVFAVTAEQSLTVAASAETLLTHANRKAGDRMGASVAVHNTTAISGAPWKAQPVAEVQLAVLSGTHDGDVVDEVQIITLMSDANAEVQRISTSTNTSLYVPYGDTRKSVWRATWNGATTRELPFNVAAMSLKEFMEEDLPGIGTLSVTRHTANPTAPGRGHAAFDWLVTFTSLSIIAPANVTAFTVNGTDLAGNGTMEVVTVSQATELGGTWQLSLDKVSATGGVTSDWATAHVTSNSTPPMAFDADPSVVEALIALTFYGGDYATGYGSAPMVTVENVVPQGGRAYRLTWNSSLTRYDPLSFVVNSSALTGSGAHAVSKTQVTGKAPVSGNFTAFVRGAGPSVPIACDADANEMRTALLALDSVDDVAVTRGAQRIDGGATWSITFLGLRHNTSYGWLPDEVLEPQRNVLPLTFDTSYVSGTGASLSVQARFNGNEASVLMPWEAHRMGTSGTRAGAAFIFENSIDAMSGIASWLEIAQLSAHDATEYDEFGSATGIYADLAVVGAPYAERYGQEEIQGVQCTADGGAFRLGFHGQFTQVLPHNVSYLELQNALEALPTIERVLVKPYSGGLCTAPAPGETDQNVGGLNASGPVRRITFPSPHSGDVVPLLVIEQPDVGAGRLELFSDTWGEQWDFAGIQGGVAGTVETSDAGVNSAIFTIHNTGSGAYTFTVTTAGTNYNSDTSSGDNTADKIVVLGTQLGGTTPANDCTLTVTGSAGAAVLSSANVAVTGTPIARTIRANASAAHISITELAKGTHVPHGDKSRYESSGAAYVFERINGTSRGWIERAKLRPHEPASQNGQSAWDSVLRSRFGHAVAITEDVIFVGAPSEGSGAGAAYIFERRGAGHRPDEPALPPFYTPEEEWLQVQRIGAGGAIEESTVHREPKAWARGLGAAGAMHSDMLVIAAPGSGFGGVNGAADAGADIGGTASSRVGKLASAIYVLRRTPYGPASSVSPSGMSYVLDQTLFATTDNTGFGASVAVLANTIVVGAPFYQRDVPATALPYGTGASRSTEQGAVFVFRRWRDDTAFELHQILTASDGIPGARLGLSTALTARGDVVMAGASERMASGALVPRAAVQTVTTRSTGTALGGTFVLTWKQRRAVASKVDAGSEFHDEREWCYPKSDVPCHEDEMRFRCVLCPSSAVPGGNAGVTWRPQATKRLAHNIRAEELSVELMKLGTGALSIVRSAADSRGGFTWSITFLGQPGQVAAPIDTMYSELTCGASGTCSASARIVKQPPPAARGSVYVWTDEAAHSVTKTSKYVEQAILLPNAYQQADLFGGGGLAAHGEVVLAGALNRDSFVSGVNAGATYAFSLDFLNFRFGQLSYAFEEDTNNATVFVHRCDGGGDKWNAYQGCRVGPQNDRGLGVQRTSVIGYATGDSASASHVPASILRREFAHVPVGTARGRAECFANSSLADDCMWILDPAVGNISTFDESAISDYVPDAAEMSFASGITVSPLVVWLTNDAHVEVPDESFHLRLNLPGMIPSYGGSLWTTITIVDDGDGGHGSRDYFERLLPPPAYSAWEKKAAADAKSYDPSTSAYADDTASGYVDWQEMGSAVEIDNNTAIVGAPRSAREGAKSVGSAFSYFRYSGVWSRKQVFVPPAGAIAGGLFGSAVSIRDSIALVGASGLARVYVYEFQGTARWSGMWVHTATLRPPTPAEATALGGDAASWAWSLLDTTAGTAGYSELAYGARGAMALSNDRGSDAFGGGSRYWWAAIGSLKCEAVFVYQRISAGGSWSLRQIVRSNDVAGVTLLGTSYLLRPAFGTSVAMSGRTIVIGAPREDAARHFNNTVAPGTAPHDEVAPAPFNGKGAVYVFYLQDVLGMNCEALYPGGDSTCEATFRWKQHKKLVATALTAGDQFGSAVALDNDQLIVGCRASNAVPSASWDFEMGDLRGWTLTGTAFDNQPTLGDNTYARNVYGENLVTSFKTKAQDWLRSPVTTFHGDPGQRIGQQGRFWVGTYENRRTNATAAGAVQGDAPVGTLTSPPFIVGGSLVDAKTGKRASEAIRSTLQIGFLIGGGCRAEETFVELLVDGEDDPLFAMRTPAQPGQGGTSNAFSGGADALGQTSGFSVLRATGRCEESMRRVWWNVSSFAGRSARLRIVDTSTTAWGHINFDDVLFSWHGPGLAMQGGLGMSSGSTDLGRGQSGQAGAVYAFRRKTEVVGSEEVCACVCNSFGCSCDGTKWGCVWQEESKLEASDKRSGDLFGFAVDVDDASGVVVVGAPGRSGTDQFNYNNARSTRERTFTESGGVYVFTRIPTRRDGLGVMLRQPSWSRARALAGARQDLQIGLEQMLLQDNTGKENRRRLGSDVSVDGYTMIAGAPGETPVGLSDAGRVGRLPWMEGRVTGSSIVLDTEVQHIGFLQGQYNVAENAANGLFTVTLVRDVLYSTTEVSIRVSTTDLTAIGVTAGQYAKCSALALQDRGKVRCGDYVQTSQELTFLVGETTKLFQITIVDDWCQERHPEYLKMQLAVVGGDSILGEGYSATLRIDDNDSSRPMCTMT